MTIPKWREEPTHRKHDRTGFDCGDEALNEFLQRHARKSHEAGGSKTFVALKESDRRTILGFYSLSPASIEFARTPALAKRGLAKHDVPGFRLARLAVAKPMQGQGLGGQLLLSAGRRCLLAAQDVGGVVLLIDAKNHEIAQRYAAYGATPLLDAPLSLVLPLATIAAALKATE